MHSLLERDHIFNVVERNRQVLGLICLIGGGVALWGAVCAMRGVCAPAARGRGRGCGRERSGQRRETAERRGAREAERDSIADGTALRNIVGEEVAATLRTSEIRLGGSFFV